MVYQCEIGDRNTIKWFWTFLFLIFLTVQQCFKQKIFSFLIYLLQTNICFVFKFQTNERLRHKEAVNFKDYDKVSWAYLELNGFHLNPFVKNMSANKFEIQVTTLIKNSAWSIKFCKKWRKVWTKKNYLAAKFQTLFCERHLCDFLVK